MTSRTSVNNNSNNNNNNLLLLLLLKSSNKRKIVYIIINQCVRVADNDYNVYNNGDCMVVIRQ